MSSENSISESTFEKYVTFPIKYHKLWNMFKKAQSTFWVVEELDLSQDLKEWEDILTEDERHFIKYVLGFFAASDGVVMENLAVNFMVATDIPEARAFYAYQIYNEAIHGETYSLLIDTYIKDPDEKDKVFKAVENYPAVGKKARWAKRWIDDKETTYAVRLIAFAVVEGIFFSGSFCAIFWLRKRGLMPGLCFSNELISKDEGCHTDFAVEMEKLQNKKPTQATVHEIFRGAVKIEKEFIIESLPCRLIGMNSEMMAQYIEFVADRLLSQLDYDKLYNTKNPFDWMENISLRPKTNFFEKRVGEYTKSGVGKEKEDFEIGNDF